MTRPLRQPSETGIHHVMNRGVDRQITFFADVDRYEFGRLLEVVHERFGVEVLAYCLMDNHFHLLVRETRGGLSDAMQHLSCVYTRHTNDRVHRDGPLFRGRFHSIPVGTEPYLLWVTRYIHLNPLDIPGVRDVARYRWSSYGAYLGRRPKPTFLNTAVVMDYFGRDPSRLAGFTQPPIGPDPFRIGRIPTAGDTTVQELCEVVACALALDDVRHGSDDATAPQWLAHTTMVLLADRLPAGPVRSMLHAHLAFRDPESARRATRRAEQRLGQVPALGRALRLVQQYLGAEALAA